MSGWLAYGVLLVIWFVRGAPANWRPRPPLHPGQDEPLRLVALHHAVFYGLLLGAPLEALVLGGSERGRAAGLLLFAVGVVGYRLAGRALGDSLSPLVTPRARAEPIPT